MTERHVLTGEERAREIRMITDGAWPHFPLLPVKRNGEGAGTEIGVIVWRYGIEEGAVRVYLVNLWDIGSRAIEFQRTEGRRATYKELLSDTETIDYDTLDQFFDAGWRGD